MKRWPAACIAAFGGLAASGCDAEVTSVGAWAPVVSGSSYVEAELGELTEGFTVGEDSRASGGHFIVPPGGTISDEAPGPARARYLFEVPSGAEYVIWGRIHAPNAINNRWVLAGGAGGYFNMGRHMKYADLPHNNLLVSVCNAMGLDDVTTVGIPGVCTGPLPGLVS